MSEPVGLASEQPVFHCSVDARVGVNVHKLLKWSVTIFTSSIIFLKWNAFIKHLLIFQSCVAYEGTKKNLMIWCKFSLLISKGH